MWKRARGFGIASGLEAVFDRGCSAAGDFLCALQIGLEHVAYCASTGRHRNRRAVIRRT